MSVTLDQILSLAGRLDDSRDFDAARERFRRFVREYVTDVAGLRTLIDQAKYAPDDQHRRAMQDLVVLAGRFLGFDVDVGAPLAPSGLMSHHGTWHAPGRLRVVVEVGTLTNAPSPSAADDLPLPGTPVVRVFVPVALPTTARSGGETRSGRPVRVIPVGELLDLAEMAMKGRLAPLEVIRMLEMGIPLDFVAGLLDRPAAAAPVPEPVAEPVPTSPRGSGYWMASVPPDYATTPEEFLELVVARRHVFGVTDRGTIVGTVRTGDGICFYLPGKGVVGHAWVASITDGASDLRDARRFRQVLKLERLSLHLAKPTSLDLETEVRLRAAPSTANRHAQMLLEISPESFRALSESATQARPTDRHGDETDGHDADVHPQAGRGRLSG
jgi:hypothetical protein